MWAVVLCSLFASGSLGVDSVNSGSLAPSFDSNTAVHLQRDTLLSPRHNVGSPADLKDSKLWHKSAAHRSASTEKSACPAVPAPGYPHEWPILDVIKNWNPDDVSIPTQLHASICRFDYRTELESARTYRNLELPFIVYNHPKMEETVKAWSSVEYLGEKLGGRKRFNVESSTNNHFMYFSGTRGPPGWTPPVKNVQMKWEEWLGFATGHLNATSEEPHLYFRTDSKASPFIASDLAMLTPGGDADGLFIVDKYGAKGIFCRFGMRGVVAAAHFDGSRNYVALMGGLRRYLISSPRNCEFMHLFPHGHPSNRHSEVDWSAPDLDQFPDFAAAKASEVILEAGDFMYIPSGWLHYVMSLNINWQCNARSGKSKGGQGGDLHKCGW